MASVSPTWHLPSQPIKQPLKSHGSFLIAHNTTLSSRNMLLLILIQTNASLDLAVRAFRSTACHAETLDAPTLLLVYRPWILFAVSNTSLSIIHNTTTPHVFHLLRTPSAYGKRWTNYSHPKYYSPSCTPHISLTNEERGLAWMKPTSY